MESIRNNLDRLIRDLRTKPLVLFLGAGINAGLGFGCKDWKDLLSKMLDGAMTELGGGAGPRIDLKGESAGDLLTRATLAKEILGRNYLPIFRRELYRNYDVKEFREDSANDSRRATIFSVARLCMPPSTVHAVVTYNYDQFLEDLLGGPEDLRAGILSGRPVNYVGEGRLPIYHVHGFLPSPGNPALGPDRDVVLSYDEYFKNVLEPNSWQTVTQSFFLMNCACLYVGTSLTDWNMLRMLRNTMLYSSNDSRYLLVCDRSIRREGPATAELRVRATELRQVGVRLIYAGRDFADFSTRIDDLKKTLGEKGGPR
jgi:hypothetical protein